MPIDTSADAARSIRQPTPPGGRRKYALAQALDVATKQRGPVMLLGLTCRLLERAGAGSEAKRQCAADERVAREPLAGQRSIGVALRSVRAAIPGWLADGEEIIAVMHAGVDAV